MKLPINDSFAIQVANQANIELEEARQRTLVSRYPHMAPQEPVRLSISEVEAVLTALHVLGHFTPPLWRETEPQP